MAILSANDLTGIHTNKKSAHFPDSEACALLWAMDRKDV